MLYELLRLARKKGASDLHIQSGVPPMVRINGRLEPLAEDEMDELGVDGIGEELLDLQHKEELERLGETDLAFTDMEAGRCRVNAFHASGKLALAIRLIPSSIPSCKAIGLPDIVEELVQLKQGLILVTGPTGSGKSTTLAALINKLNQEEQLHIITLEEPIEYVYPKGRCLIEQREVRRDTASFNSGLRSCLRQDPDVILVGELRDKETTEVALAAAETGHLVLSTLHTLGAAASIDRIIDMFADKELIRNQLSVGLQGIISQQLLINRAGNERIAAFEILVATEAMRNLIREGKTHQLKSYMETGSRHGMITMEKSLQLLKQQGLI